MSPERWRQVEEVYHSALEWASDQRATFLDEACGDDHELRREVESLLGRGESQEALVDRPVWEAAGELLDARTIDQTRDLAGHCISHYEIIEKLGEGGMGVVYRARDTRLGRDVAVKVLAERFTSDHQRMARFEREAHVLASLNHPNIASIHGLEEQDGIRALVMELVSGPTLADRIAEGAIPLKEALRLAEQMAEALEYAHEHGVVHRDLKPANVKLSEEGTVKVLDFGLAKAMADEAAVSDPNHSPTLTLEATTAGVILGTAAYMSPEQARGKKVDKRADIWAFGVVLYEMLTGKRPFQGEDVTETLASVVKEQPDLSAAPPRVRRLLEKCLEKDPKKRLRDISGVTLLLEAQTGPVEVRRPRLPWAVTAVATIALLALAFVHFRQAPPELQAVHFSMEPPPTAVFTNQYGGYAPSPDGRYVLFTAEAEGGTYSLWLRPLDSGTARKLAGTEGGNFPTWSPDSRSLAFCADGRLKRIEVAGGPALTLGEAIDDAVSPTGTWNRDGVILFGSAAGLQRVSASGGGATPLTKVDAAKHETGHGFPQFLPDGDRFLYFVASNDPSVQGVYASSLGDPGQRNLVVRTAAKAVYVPPRAAYPGYLLWLQDQTLVARRFDPGSLEFEGDPATVADGIGLHPDSPVRAAFWASEAGLLTYFSDFSADRRVVWMSRDGVGLEEVGPSGASHMLALAPQGGRMAISRSDASGNTDIWVREFASSREIRLTFDPASDTAPTWSPDGKQVAFSSNREGSSLQIYVKDASGVGEAKRLTEGPNDKLLYDWSPDRRFLLYRDMNPETGKDVMALPLKGDQAPIAVVHTQFDEVAPAVSPKGEWLAYSSSMSGRQEVYVQAFPGTEGESQKAVPISLNGGSFPRWRGDGKELYWQNLAGDLMTVAIDDGPEGIQVGTPRQLLTGLRLGTGAAKRYDVTPDGKRFLLILPSAEQPQLRLTVELNWQARLER